MKISNLLFAFVAIIAVLAVGLTPAEASPMAVVIRRRRPREALPPVSCFNYICIINKNLIHINN